MPVNSDFKVNIGYPGTNKEDQPDQVVVKPDPDALAKDGSTLGVEVHVTDRHAKILEDNDKNIPSPQSGKGLPDMTSLNVLGSNLKKQDICALIGRDILRHCLLVYDGTSGSIMLAV